MQELQKLMQMEEFDVEVQICDPYDCNLDCLQGPDDCDAVITGLL